MSGYTWKLFDWFAVNRGESKTRMAINSNLAVGQDKIDQLLAAAKNVELDIYTSNESMYKQAEYIRDGLDWNQWCNNLRFLLDSKRLRGLHVMCTVNALCLASLTEFLQLIAEIKREYGRDALSFTLNILRFPSFQSPLVLPKTMRNEYGQQLIKFSDDNGKLLHEHEIKHVQRLVSYLNIHNATSDLVKLHNDFKKFYMQYDQRRGKNFRDAFPQFTEWYDTL